LKERRNAPEMENLIDGQLKAIDEDYRDLNTLLGLQPVRVTLLPQGTFQRYYDQKRSEGADLAHLKPPHINAPDAVIQRLLQLSRQDEG
ncbi:MAG: GH3 auxin-responsive promoter family protein, partial [Chloroflexota bacterium]|nr:GH3 auxin-responsive promoter family protein [Chloroflexota bacterium]